MYEYSSEHLNYVSVFFFVLLQAWNGWCSSRSSTMDGRLLINHYTPDKVAFHMPLHTVLLLPLLLYCIHSIHCSMNIRMENILTRFSINKPLIARYKRRSKYLCCLFQSVCHG